ncbi:Sel1 domain-containing protein [Campylobacter blaseri]|uniref:beta-lactamase n=1 Tax=Campylobacter blaseri TaxID=2042961 RepID=A0A2P8R0I8_9BACT|nr:sel1 repeat family protein [Campylobacter blaseri]PSM52015.1 hypothetical protein CQ405_05475 [Campylobacter blaseri]PSM53800.1 hypothetical protein CRN67_05475 [Campylobacter blaseri]QKF85648.1 Sel1 domain-containing protein [Campylobacter blaseri]
MKQILTLIFMFFIFANLAFTNDTNKILNNKSDIKNSYNLTNLLSPYLDCNLGDFEIYIKECSKNKNAKSCFTLGSCLYIGGVRNLSHKDGSVCLEQFNEACKYNNAKGCLMSAIMLDDSNMTQKAFTYYKKACELDTKFCTELGHIYFKQGDYNMALKYHEISCNNNSFYACASLGNIYDIKLNDQINANKNYKKACDNGVKEGCQNLGFYHYNKTCKNNECKNYDKDFEMAIKYFTKGCDDLNYYKSCYYLANLYRFKNSEKSKFYFKKASDSTIKDEIKNF